MTQLSYRGLSPVSSDPRSLELAARWIPATSAGMTTSRRQPQLALLAGDVDTEHACLVLAQDAALVGLGDLGEAVLVLQLLVDLHVPEPVDHRLRVAEQRALGAPQDAIGADVAQD